MRTAIAILVLAASASTVAAQGAPGGLGDFQKLNSSGGVLEFNIETGRVDRISGNPAEVELIPPDPSKPALVVRASEMRFRYENEDSEPEGLVLTGNVRVRHPQGDITADSGDWNGQTGELNFKGNPVVMKRQTGGDLTAPEITFNTVSGKLTAKGGFKLVNMPLSGTPAAPEAKVESPYLFVPADIKDWPGFLTRLNEQGASADPSPGRQILAQLRPEVRKQLGNITTRQTPNAATQEVIVKELNGVLDEVDLYDADAWKGVALDADGQALLEKGAKMNKGELIRFNRRLIEAAYPDYIVRKE